MQRSHGELRQPIKRHSMCVGVSVCRCELPTHIRQQALVEQRKQGGENLLLGQVAAGAHHHHGEAGLGPVVGGQVHGLRVRWEGGPGSQVQTS